MLATVPMAEPSLTAERRRPEGLFVHEARSKIDLTVRRLWRKARSDHAVGGIAEFGPPFLNTYRTMCRAPEPAVRQILEDVRELRFAA